MRIYILRHAIAIPRGTPGFQNDDRPLTDDGIAKMKKAAQGISKSNVNPDHIFSSPLKRAISTAAIVAEALHFNKRIEINDHLLPDANPQLLFEHLAKRKKTDNILVVGHNPQIEQFASLLLGSEKPIIKLKKGGMCCIDKISSRQTGRLLWHVTPLQLRNISHAK